MLVGGFKAVLAAAGLLVLLGAGNSVGFAVRASSLESNWQSEEALGVSPGHLASARAEVAAMRSRWLGPLPYPVASGAILVDPFGKPEAIAAANRAAATNAARARARVALQQLREAAGPNFAGYYDAELALGRANLPAEINRLADGWLTRAALTAALRDQLSAASGGLADGLPQDVAAGLARLQDLRTAAGAAGLATDPAGDAIAEAQIYLARSYPIMLAEHQAVLGDVTAAVAALQGRLDRRHDVDEKLARASRLISDVEQYASASEFRDRLQNVRGQLAEATTEDRLAALSTSLDGLVRDLEDAKTRYERAAAQARANATAATTACIQGAQAQLIVIHLATQQLVAYDNGCPWLQTAITTGRSALPTDRGTFQVFYKAPVYKMVSPWPKGSPYWYPDTYVYNAMEFVSDGTFIHSADWQPASSYGAGSQNGPYASHGCVHVQNGPLQQLYNWAAIGTTVVVGD